MLRAISLCLCLILPTAAFAQDPSAPAVGQPTASDPTLAPNADPSAQPRPRSKTPAGAESTPQPVSPAPLAAKPQAGAIVVRVTGLRSDKGEVEVDLYASDDGFPGKPKKAKTTLWGKIDKGASTVEFKDVPNGTYAIATCHDENANKECDTNILGIPKEGVATSKRAHHENMIPKYEKASFKVNGDTVNIPVLDYKY